ncbi:MAG TPA: hypothetical protein VH165_25070 [Kofleriaceae bacterium]|nr:hypothetical protein [Kofleriaceae bacterium]
MIPMWGCLATADDPAGDESSGETSAVTSELTGTASDGITFKNNGTASVTPSGLNIAGFLSSQPVSPVLPGGGDSYTETGVGNITSFHIDYSAGSKRCHFDSASFPSGSSCTFTKNAQSQGGTFATCTATLTSFNLMTCSQTVTFTMQ